MARYSELIGKQINVLCLFDIDIKMGTKELRWCQGEVIEVVEGVQDPTVKVKWDAQLDAHGYEKSTITNQRLLPTRWRKDREGRWRMDVEIDIESKIDNESDEDSKGKGEEDMSKDKSDSEISDEELSDDMLIIDNVNTLL